jgi:hypothetical protein
LGILGRLIDQFLDRWFCLGKKVENFFADAAIDAPVIVSLKLAEVSED